MPKRKGSNVTDSSVKLVTDSVFFQTHKLEGPYMFYHFSVSIDVSLRTMADALMKRMDDKRVCTIKTTGEFWPGGDIRIRGNQWLRSAFERAGITKCPRENAMRHALRVVCKKHSLRLYLSMLQHDEFDDGIRFLLTFPDYDTSIQVVGRLMKN